MQLHIWLDFWRMNMFWNAHLVSPVVALANSFTMADLDKYSFAEEKKLYWNNSLFFILLPQRWTFFQNFILKDNWILRTQNIVTQDKHSCIVIWCLNHRQPRPLYGCHRCILSPGEVLPVLATMDSAPGDGSSVRARV